MPSGLYENATAIRKIMERVRDAAKALPEGQWRLYFNDGEHYSGMTNKQLAELLSTGNETGGPGQLYDIGLLPARPALQQWKEEEGENVRDMIRKTIKDDFNKIHRDSRGRFSSQSDAIEKDVAFRLLMSFFAFVDAARVHPENSPYTIMEKGFNKPWVYHGDLMEEGLECEYEPERSGRTSHSSFRVTIRGAQ